MPTIVLQDTNDALLGFLLVAGDDTVLKSGGKRDCVFTGVPKDPALFDTPECSFVQEHKNTEWFVTVVMTRHGPQLQIALPGWLFLSTLSPSGVGEWNAIREGADKLAGNCQLVKKRDV